MAARQDEVPGVQEGGEAVNEIGGFVRAIRAAEERGEITRQQRRTLEGQAKNGDLRGAYKGLVTIYGRMDG